MNKKGLSPVIATVLLISLVLVLAAIIFLWAKAFIPETIQKFDSPIQDSCADVVFEAAYKEGIVTVQNNGNIAIYSIQAGVRKTLGSLEYVTVDQGPAIVSGGSRDFSVSGVSIGDDLSVIPVLLGKTDAGELRAFACGDESAKIITAG